MIKQLSKDLGWSLDSQSIYQPSQSSIINIILQPQLIHGQRGTSTISLDVGMLCVQLVQKMSCYDISLRVPWTARRSNKSTLKEISPEYSPEGPMLKLKLQYFGHLMRRTDSLEKTLMLGKIEGRTTKDDKGMTKDEMAGWNNNK